MVFFEQFISGLSIGSVYALLGIGFTIIFAATKRINFAHGDFMTFGGFMGIVFLHVIPGMRIFALLLAALSVGCLAVAVELVFLRRLQEKVPLHFVIATIGLSIMFKIVMKLMWGSDPLPYPPLLPNEPIRFLGAYILPHTILILGVIAFFTIALQLFFQHTTAGRSLRALSQDNYAARLMGVRIGRSISLTYLLSGFLAGVAGVLVGPLFFISSTMGTILGLKSFVAAVIGGLGNIPGTIAGGLLLGITENLTSGFLSSAYKNGISLIFLILVLLFRPQGLLTGLRFHKKTLSPEDPTKEAPGTSAKKLPKEPTNTSKIESRR